MTTVQQPLETTALLAHARVAARSDEQRHSLNATAPRRSRHSEQTIRGWGGAALVDLEWASHYVYPKAQKDEYRRTYAEEYQAALSAR